MYFINSATILFLSVYTLGVYCAILRPNYGVTLHEVGFFTSTNDEFLYSFVLPFPDKLPDLIHIADFPCVNENSTLNDDDFVASCFKIQRLIDLMYNDTFRLSLTLNDTIDKLKSVLLPHDTSERSARKLFSFLVEIWQSLTGSPSERSFKELKNNVRY